MWSKGDININLQYCAMNQTGQCVRKNVNPTATVTISEQVDLGSCEPGI